MKRSCSRSRHLAALFAFLALGTAPAVSWALGPLDAEVGLLWWSHDIEDDEIGKTNADAGGAYAELWWANNWGLAADYYDSDPDIRGLSSTTDFSFDVKRRLLSPTENNFVSLGLGWQDSELLGGGSADGVRLTLDGRVGLGILHGYGRAVWMPDLGDAGVRRDIEGTEYQFGISFTPLPFFNLRLGYRVYELDYNGGSEKSDGYLLGGAIHF